MLGSIGDTIRDSDFVNCQGWQSYFNPGCYFGDGISPQHIPTAAEQVSGMHFGRASDPQLVAQAKQDFANYLDATGYDATISDLKKQDEIGSFVSLILMVGAVVVGVVIVDSVISR